MLQDWQWKGESAVRKMSLSTCAPQACRYSFPSWRAHQCLEVGLSCTTTTGCLRCNFWSCTTTVVPNFCSDLVVDLFRARLYIWEFVVVVADEDERISVILLLRLRRCAKTITCIFVVLILRAVDENCRMWAGSAISAATTQVLVTRISDVHRSEEEGYSPWHLVSAADLMVMTLLVHRFFICLLHCVICVYLPLAQFANEHVKEDAALRESNDGVIRPGVLDVLCPIISNLFNVVEFHFDFRVELLFRVHAIALFKGVIHVPVVQLLSICNSLFHVTQNGLTLVVCPCLRATNVSPLRVGAESGFQLRTTHLVDSLQGVAAT
mmetsp:Transcript_54520/g.99925  ORF Transcript_54520/g.99925 Transcript_54520/m.99925 type:complete len:323 (-) Transcript_54520:1040-2008(-)